MIAWPVSARFSRGPLTMGNLPREAKNTKNVGYFSYGLTRRKSHQNLAVHVKKWLAKLQLTREALCLALTDLSSGPLKGKRRKKLSARSTRFARNTCTCFTFLFFFFHSLRIICFAWSFIFNVVQTSFFLTG